MKTTGKQAKVSFALWGVLCVLASWGAAGASAQQEVVPNAAPNAEATPLPKDWSEGTGIGTVLDDKGQVSGQDGRMTAPQNQVAPTPTPAKVLVLIGDEVQCSVEAATDMDHWTRDDNDGDLNNNNEYNDDFGDSSDGVNYTWSGGNFKIGSNADGTPITAPSVTGTSAIWIAPTTPSTYTVTCKIDDTPTLVESPETPDNGRDDSPVIRSVDIKVDRYNLTVSPDPSTPADPNDVLYVTPVSYGKSNHLIKARLTWASDGTPAVGKTVSFSVGGYFAQMVPSSSTTQGDGYALTTISADAHVPGQATIYARAGTGLSEVNSSTTIYFIGGEFTSPKSNIYFWVAAGPSDSRQLLVLCNGASPIFGFNAKEQPTGTTLLWEIVSGSDKAQIVGSNTSASVSVQGTQKSAGQGDVTLKLTYKLHGYECEAAQTLTVHKPSPAHSSQDLGSAQTWTEDGSGGRKAYTWRRVVTYTVRSQFSWPIAHVTWDETVTPAEGVSQRDGQTNAQGQIPDELFYGSGSTSVNMFNGQASKIWLEKDQTIKVDGCPDNPASLYFWHNKIQMTGLPDVVVTPVSP